MVWWIASWAEDEQLQGKNNLLRRGVLELGELEWWLWMEWLRSKMICLLRWWLVLFIEALVLFQILSGKGSHNGQFEGGQLVQAILTKGGLRLPKALVVTPSWAPR